MKSMKSFFSKKSILGTMAVAAVCMLGTGNAQAQEFTIQGDLVSSYVWRGIYQGGAASFQPTLGFSVGNFSLTAWGSTSLSESNKEIDLTAAYKFGEAGPTLSVASLWWNGQADVANGELTNDYFHFKSGDTGHHFEAGLAYTLPIEKFPLSIAWYTMFAGADRKMTDLYESLPAFTVCSGQILSLDCRRTGVRADLWFPDCRPSSDEERGYDRTCLRRIARPGDLCGTFRQLSYS